MKKAQIKKQVLKIMPLFLIRFTKIV